MPCRSLVLRTMRWPPTSRASSGVGGPLTVGGACFVVLGASHFLSSLALSRSLARSRALSLSLSLSPFGWTMNGVLLFFYVQAWSQRSFCREHVRIFLHFHSCNHHHCDYFVLGSDYSYRFLQAQTGDSHELGISQGSCVRQRFFSRSHRPSELLQIDEPVSKQRSAN